MDAVIVVLLVLAVLAWIGNEVRHAHHIGRLQHELRELKRQRTAMLPKADGTRGLATETGDEVLEGVYGFPAESPLEQRRRSAAFFPPLLLSDEPCLERDGEYQKTDRPGSDDDPTAFEPFVDEGRKRAAHESECLDWLNEHLTGFRHTFADDKRLAYELEYLDDDGQPMKQRGADLRDCVRAARTVRFNREALIKTNTENA